MLEGRGRERELLEGEERREREGDKTYCVARFCQVKFPGRWMDFFVHI